MPAARANANANANANTGAKGKPNANQTQTQTHARAAAKPKQANNAIAGATNNNTKRPRGAAANSQDIDHAETAFDGSRNSSLNMLPPKKKLKLNFSKPDAPMVKVLIGGDEVVFAIHKNAICAHSSYFRSIFNDHSSSTVEGKVETKIIKLPTVEPKVFGLFSNYIYTQEVEHDGDNALEVMELARLWSHAEEWKIPRLQNKVAELLVPMVADEQFGVGTDENTGAYEGSLLREFVGHAYATTTAMSDGNKPLKKLAALKVMMWASRASSPRSIREWSNDFPEGLVMHLAEALIEHFNCLPKGARKPKFDVTSYCVCDEE